RLARGFEGRLSGTPDLAGETSGASRLDSTSTLSDGCASCCADVCVWLVDEGSSSPDERNQKAATISIAKPSAPTALITNGREDLRTGLRGITRSGTTADRSNGRPRALQKSSRFFRLVATKRWPGSRAVVAML